MIIREFPRSTSWQTARRLALPTAFDANSVSTLFKPSDLSTLVAHWDANLGVETSGTHGAALLPAVDSWASQGQSVTLSATTTARPYLTTAPNGLAAIGLLRANDALEGGTADSGIDRMVSGTVAGDFVSLPATVFVVCTRTVDSAVFDRAFLLNPGNPNNGWGFSWNQNDNAMRMLIGTGSATAAVVMGTPSSPQTGTFFAAKFDNGASASWLEGTAGLTSSSALAIGANPTFQLSATTSSNRMQFWEILTFKEAMSTANRQKVEGYLAHKWGLAGKLPADHPYKLMLPTK